MIFKFLVEVALYRRNDLNCLRGWHKKHSQNIEEHISESKLSSQVLDNNGDDKSFSLEDQTQTNKLVHNIFFLFL